MILRPDCIRLHPLRQPHQKVSPTVERTFQSVLTTNGFSNPFNNNQDFQEVTQCGTIPIIERKYQTMSDNTNLFFFGKMITDPHKFVGRRTELATITARLNAAQPQGSSIVGPRRIGKSSLLHYLYQPRPNETLCAADNLLVVFLSASDGRCDTADHFRATLIAETITKAQPNRRTKAGKWLEQVRQKCESTQTCDWNTAREALTKLNALGNHPVICLDEFEALIANGFDDRDFNALRNWANVGLLTWITASAIPLPELRDLHSLTSPFFNLLATVPLGDLTDDEVTALLGFADDTPYEISYREQKFLQRVGGNNPYHLQIAAWKMCQMKFDGDISHSKIRDFLCQQPNPPTWCANTSERKRISERHLITLSVLLLIVLIVSWYALSSSFRNMLKAIREALIKLGEPVDGITVLIVVGAFIFGVLWRGKTVVEMVKERVDRFT